MSKSFRVQQHNTPQQPPVIQQTELVVSRTFGPLPSSSEMEGYHRILATAPDRIIAMAEHESAHRH
jgi:uncharacterized membrane protein